MTTRSIKILALDLDGTLVSGNAGISRRVRAVLGAAQARGVAITIATGRMFRSARRFARDLGVQIPIICYQGALVRHPVSGETLFASSLPVAPALAVVEYARARHIHINAYVDDELIMEALTPEGRFYADTSDVPIELVDDLARAVEVGTTKLVLVTDENRVLDIVADLSRNFGDELTITRSHPRFAEAITPGIDKGTGLRLLTRSLGVPIEQTMAIGDNLNDLDLVQAAGLGIAMRDGDPRVLAAADWVTGSHAEDGVATAVERFILPDAEDR